MKLRFTSDPCHQTSPTVTQWDLQGLLWENLEAPQELRTKQYTTNLQRHKTRNSLQLSPEVVAFQNSLPLKEGWGRQYPPSRLLLKVGNPS